MTQEQQEELTALLAAFRHIQNNLEVIETEADVQLGFSPVKTWKLCRLFSDKPREDLMKKLSILEGLGVLTDQKFEQTNAPGRRPEIRVLDPCFYCEDQSQFEELCHRLVKAYRATIVKPAHSPLDLGPLRVRKAFTSCIPNFYGVGTFKACQVIADAPTRIFFSESGGLPVVPLTDRSTVTCQNTGCFHTFGVADALHDSSIAVVRINRDEKKYRNSSFVTYVAGTLISDRVHAADLIAEGLKPEDSATYVICPKCRVAFDFEPWARFVDRGPMIESPPPAALVEVTSTEEAAPSEPEEPAGKPPLTDVERKRQQRLASPHFQAGSKWAAEKMVDEHSHLD